MMILFRCWQFKNSEFCAPLTSFDWNESDPSIIGTSSIDTTCTIWNIEVPSFSWFFFCLWFLLSLFILFEPLETFEPF